MAIPRGPLPEVLKSVAFGLASFEQSDLAWDADGEMFLVLLSAGLCANRRRMSGTGYPFATITGRPGSGRTTSVRKVAASLVGPLEYFEINRAHLSEAVVSALEARLSSSRRSTIVLVQEIDAMLGPTPLSPGEDERRVQLVRLVAAVVACPSATLIIEKEETTSIDIKALGLPAIGLNSGPPKLTAEILAIYLARQLATMLKLVGPMDWLGLGRVALAGESKTWAEIRDRIKDIAWYQSDERGERRYPPLDQARLAHHLAFGPWLEPSPIKPKLAHDVAIHEAAHALCDLVCAGPSAVNLMIMAHAPSSNFATGQTSVNGYTGYEIVPGPNFAQVSEISSAAGRIAEEVFFGVAQSGCNQDLAKMRASILSRIAAAVKTITSDSGLSPADMDAWLPGQIAEIEVRLTAETLRAAREIVLANQAGLERLAVVLARERFLVGDRLADAFRVAAFVDLFGQPIGPGLAWNPPDLAAYRLDPAKLLNEALKVEIERLRLASTQS
jgi:hypothetical protein